MLHLQITGDLLLVGLLFIHYYPTHHIRGKGGKIGTPHNFWVAVANLHAASLPDYCFPIASRSRFDALQSHQTGASCMTWDTPWATGIQAAVPYSAPQQLLTGFHVGSQVYAVLLNVAVAIISTSTSLTEEGVIAQLLLVGLPLVPMWVDALLLRCAHLEVHTLLLYLKSWP